MHAVPSLFLLRPYLDLQHLVHRGSAESHAPEAIHRGGQIALELLLHADVFLRTGVPIDKRPIERTTRGKRAENNGD